MPNPRSGEDRTGFLSRCMGDSEMIGKFPEQDQRYAVCLSYWDNRKDDTMDIQYKSVDIEIKKVHDADGVFEGYASVFNIVDDGMDSVQRGAFVKSLAGRKPKMLWQHDREKVIGTWEEIREDERGLYVKGRIFKDIQQGAEAITLLKEGEIDSMSIGYVTIESTYEGNGSVRLLKEVDLYEVSLVTFPMLNAAKVTSVKAIETERDFERFLRDAGYSRAEAKAVASHGFKAIQRDAGDNDPDAEEMKQLLNSLTNLKESIK